MIHVHVLIPLLSFEVDTHINHSTSKMTNLEMAPLSQHFLTDRQSKSMNTLWFEQLGD